MVFATEAHIVGVPQVHWSSGYMWFITLLSVVAALLPDIVKRAYVDMFDPLYAKKRERLVSVAQTLHCLFGWRDCVLFPVPSTSLDTLSCHTLSRLIDQRTKMFENIIPKLLVKCFHELLVHIYE